MQQRGVLINASPIVRLVTHLDVSRQQLSGGGRPLAGIFER
jgi:threonine aldolase